ncbi:MAG: hypothetical protein ACYTKD_12270 [Planctomycetota bacterium]|jgi:hypothetical protein
MEIKSTVCQLRWDIQGEGIPGSALLADDVKAKLASVVGKQADDSSPVIAGESEFLSRVGREKPEVLQEAMAALRKAQKQALRLENAFYRPEERGTDSPGPYAVEMVDIETKQMYVRVAGETSICRQVLEKMRGVLEKSGVPPAVFADHEVDHASKSVVQLDGVIEGFFSPAFVEFTQSSLAIAAQRNTGKRVVVHPYNIEMKVHEWGKEPPFQHTQWDFSIAHATYEDHDKRLYKVYTRSDFDTHCRLLEELNNCLK